MEEKINAQAKKSDIIRDIKGTTTYLPQEQLIREHILKVLKAKFILYGFLPFESTILEFYDLAASKYGGGSEILKETYHLKDQGERDLCLRYELTFKLAKAFAMNPNTRLPFRRYEIGKVFRDGPVKSGRLREFTQCDVDVIGISEVIAEAEFMEMSSKVFNELGINVVIKINNKKILYGLINASKFNKESFSDFALTIDKLDKIGISGVEAELEEKKFPKESIELLKVHMQQIGAIKENQLLINYLSKALNGKEEREGIDELKTLFNTLKHMDINCEIVLSPVLSRGLTYYTGFIWEVYAKELLRP